jgi:WD40 repeat protein
VPGYYVALMRAGTPSLVVGSTFTGQAIATVKAPDQVVLGAVYGGAADDRTFVVTGTRHGSGATAWYLLRIAPGSAAPARLTPLPLPVRQSPAGAALSPDGATVAVAVAGSPATLGVYSVATGARLRQWSATEPGEFTAEQVKPGSRQFTAMVLRWSPDGRQLAFAWNASAIRVLDATAPDGNLITSSRVLAAIGTTYATLSSFTCRGAQGWQFITVARGPGAGQGVVCAGSSQTGRYTACSSPSGTKCGYTQRNAIGFLRATEDSRGGSYLGLDTGSDCPSPAQPGNGAYLGWANADGSEVIGSQVCAGRSRFGLFHGTAFTALPALPGSLPLPAGVMDGTVAW